LVTPHSERNQDTALIGHVSDDAPERLRHRLHQRWGSDDIAELGHLRVLIDVHDLESVPTVEVLVTQTLYALDGLHGPLSRAGYEQTQHILVQGIELAERLLECGSR
jgi:hypothetical protein